MRTSPLALALLCSHGLSAPLSGSIECHVILVDEIPDAPTVAVDKTPEFCGDTIQDPILVGTNRGIALAVVSIKTPVLTSDTNKPQTAISLVGAHCLFSPRVQACVTGTSLLIGSRDSIPHNPHGWHNQTTTVFNITVPNPDTGFKRRLRMPGLYRVDCDTHRWMHAYVAVFDHTYFSVTDFSGSAIFTNIPPGPYTINVWHEVLGETNFNVSVLSNATNQCDIVWPLIDRRPREMRPPTIRPWPK
jgi:hypothetical protein